MVHTLREKPLQRAVVRRVVVFGGCTHGRFMALPLRFRRRGVRCEVRMKHVKTREGAGAGGGEEGVEGCRIGNVRKEKLEETRVAEGGGQEEGVRGGGRTWSGSFWIRLQPRLRRRIA